MSQDLQCILWCPIILSYKMMWRHIVVRCERKTYHKYYDLQRFHFPSGVDVSKFSFLGLLKVFDLHIFIWRYFPSLLSDFVLLITWSCWIIIVDLLFSCLLYLFWDLFLGYYACFLVYLASHMFCYYYWVISNWVNPKYKPRYYCVSIDASWITKITYNHLVWGDLNARIPKYSI